ncbi:MAG TPA: ATP-binding protein [Aliidongia sp.]|nr:ATP-binding protein [Aliidongia sp.]
MAVAGEPAVPQDFFQGGGELGRLMRAFDWDTTPLGPPVTWPRSLQSIVRMMLTSRYQMWMAWGAQLTFFCNDAYRPTLGVKHPWALGRPARAVWAEIWPDIGPLIDTVLETGEATYSEAMLLFLERSGFPEETYHTFSYSPLFDDAGAIAGMFCVVVEETERVINERRLGTLRKLASAASATRTEQALFEAAEAELSDNIADLPFTLTYLFDAGQGWARLAAMTGMAPGASAAPSILRPGDGLWPVERVLDGADSVIVERLADRFPDLPSGAWDKPPTQALLVPIAQQGPEQGAAGVLIVGLNPYRTVDQGYRGFLELLAGQIAAALATARAYEAERKRAEALAELDRAKTAFFSNVSHEFRTPLTLMLGPLEEILSGGPTATPGEVRPQIELAHRNGVRLLRLVNNLLDFSRIEAGRVQASFVETDLAGFSAEIASSFRSAMDRAGLTLTVDARALPAPVFLDRDMWEKVLLNLLSNAFKFTFAGGVAIAIGPSADGRFAEVRVSDTGIGVAPEELPRLFERFHRVEGAKGRTFEGSGIGLALVQELVKLHEGSISAESEPGRGTSFTIRLPLGTAHLPAAQLHEPPRTGQTTNAHAFVEEALRWLPEPEKFGAELGVSNLVDGAGAESLPGVGKRVLVADDNADMRDYVRRLLNAQGYEVESVGDGEAALAAARARTPDLVLSDVMMPKLDGFGLLRAIRGEAAIAGTPVILLSARAGEEAKVEGLDAGADDYLIKPFAARELLARVSANIQMSRVRREAAREVMRSEQRVIMTQERLTLALSTGRIAIFELDVEANRATVLGPLAEFFGVPEADAAQGLPLPLFIAGIDAGDRDRVAALIARSIEDGTPYEAEYRLVGGDFPRCVVARGVLQTLPGGGRRMVGAIIDVSDEKEAEEALREQTKALESLNRAGASVAADLELESVVQTITDAGVELTGAQFGAFFYNVTNEAGESYALYSLSGVPREEFDKFPMPRNTDVFAPTFSGEGVVRSDDITADPRYGRNTPHRGMPEGHLPVRSYLAVPVISRSGEVLGGLFFGHARTGRFGQQEEDLMAGLAGQAAIAIDNVRLFQAAQMEIRQRRATEAALQSLNAELEERVATELAERLKAEDALRQAQKMEAVGQLTGGVAHDFNNLLTVIIGGLETVRRGAPGDNVRLSRAVDMAMQGAQRAATLTARLLAFSRRQPLEPKPLDLNLVVRDSTELLHRTLGETIELEGVLAPRLWPVEIDQNQLESAILNLAVNARDAMPEGGKLTIETGNTMLDESYAATDTEVIPGQYAVLSISDSGTGMSKEVLGHVFEPFYTTKGAGRGTGLGLSMVYGFVKQSGGHVTIYSEEGQGTTVRLYFPRYRGDLPVEGGSPDAGAPLGLKGEIILVVEDNEDVRAYSVMTLTELGYGVLEAADAEAALAILERPGRIDLLFTDVVLPGKTGRVLADEAQRLRPGLRVLFTTGYSRNAIVHQGRLDAGVHLITKPFTFDQLAGRIRDVLDR